MISEKDWKIDEVDSTGMLVSCNTAIVEKRAGEPQGRGKKVMQS